MKVKNAMVIVNAVMLLFDNHICLATIERMIQAIYRRDAGSSVITTLLNRCFPGSLIWLLPHLLLMDCVIKKDEHGSTIADYDWPKLLYQYPYVMKFQKQLTEHYQWPVIIEALQLRKQVHGECPTIRFTPTIADSGTTEPPAWFLERVDFVKETLLDGFLITHLVHRINDNMRPIDLRPGYFITLSRVNTESDEWEQLATIVEQPTPVDEAIVPQTPPITPSTSRKRPLPFDHEDVPLLREINPISPRNSKSTPLQIQPQITIRNIKRRRIDDEEIGKQGWTSVAYSLMKYAVAAGVGGISTIAGLVWVAQQR